jgi:sulfatase-like protein
MTDEAITRGLIRAPGKHRAPRRPIPFHPVLLASIPVLALWAHNASEGIGIRDVIEPLGVIVGGTVAVLLIATGLIRRDLRKGALTASVALFLVFSYGPLTGAMESVPSGVVIGLSVVLCAAAIFGIVRARQDRIIGLTKSLNFVAAGLVVFNIVSIGINQEGAFTPTDLPGPLAGVGQGSTPVGKPDIYYIVLDEYGGERAMRELLGFDNRPFLDELEKRGFYLPEHPSTNYPRTLPYLAATLNMDYVHNLVPEGTKVYGGTLKPLINDDRVPKVLKSNGYDYIHIGSWVKMTETNPQADRNVVLGHGLSEFSNALLGGTVVAPALEAVGTPEFARQQYDRALFQFDQLAQSKKVEGPKFVFGHIIVPHWPFIFDAKGKFTPSDITMEEIKPPLDEVPKEVHRRYIDQVKFVNQKVLTLLDTLLSGPPETDPIVLLQSDEGFFTWLYGGPDASDRDLQQHFSILDAYYFPRLKETGLYPSITPVNSFRLVFNKYFGADLPLLPDRNYVLTGGQTEWVDVTDRVRPLL